MQERGYQLGNVDVTIIAQKPKLSPHKEKMRDQLCTLIGSHPSTVNIKVSRIPHGSDIAKGMRFSDPKPPFDSVTLCYCFFCLT